MLEHDYDLVLMDYQMPGVDGLDATRRIRSLDCGKSIVPIVAMTSNAMPEDRRACLEAGMDDFLAKPVRLDDLAEVLSRWLPTGSTRPSERSRPSVTA